MSKRVLGNGCANRIFGGSHTDSKALYGAAAWAARLKPCPDAAKKLKIVTLGGLEPCLPKSTSSSQEQFTREFAPRSWRISGRQRPSPPNQSPVAAWCTYSEAATR